jgi:ABC-type multidrug transport system fused ATPase/permease subunit
LIEVKARSGAASDRRFGSSRRKGRPSHVKLLFFDAPRSVALEPLPAGLFGYVRRISARDQALLCALSVAVFLLATAPVELQRRIVNVALENRDFAGVAMLCGIYVGVTLAAGVLKLVLHVYRGWVSENAVRQLRIAAYDIAAERHTDARANARHEGIGMAVILAEAENVGGFVGISVSEPLLQLGILLSVFGYMLALEPSMAALSFLLFAPQLVFVPLFQRRINDRARDRIKVLRAVSGDLIDDWTRDQGSIRRPVFLRRIDRVFALNLRIFKLKFSMNFLINELHHIGIVAILLAGSWLPLGGAIEIGTVVAFVSGLARVKEPWGDLVSYLREMTVVRVKYGRVAPALTRTQGLAEVDRAA